MAVVLVLLAHQVCAYPVSSREQVTDLQRALASLLVRAQLREEAEQQRSSNEEALAQDPCIQDATNGCKKQEANARAQESHSKEAENKMFAQEALLRVLAKVQASEQRYPCPPLVCGWNQ